MTALPGKALAALRLGLRLPLFITFLLLCVVIALGLRLAEALRGKPVDRGPVVHALLATLCKLLGFRLQINGQAPPQAALFVSNHISWTDIPVLAACTPLRFLAKEEVGKWPLIGWLATEGGTLFIKRRSGQALRVREQITQALRDSQSILIFPEGTTTAGISVLPFHGRLLGAAADAGVPVQPISIGYRRDGLPDAIAPFIGDDDFVGHLLRLLRQPPVTLEVRLHAPVRAQEGENLNAFAQRLTRTVAEGLAQIHSPGHTRAGGAPLGGETELAS